jgi:hypothetical protein
VTARDNAAHLLAHYLQLACERAGVHWDSDNTTEVHDIVGLIIDAAVEETLDTLASQRHER